MNVDPRVKIVILCTLSSLAVLFQNVSSLITLFLTCIVVLCLLKCDLIKLMKPLSKLIKLVLIMGIIQSIYSSGGNVIFSVFNINILTSDGIEKGLIFLFRMLTILFSASILKTCTSRDIIQGLYQLKVPYDFSLMAVMGIKFVPILQSHFSDTINAIQLRGVDIKKQSLKEKINLISCFLIPVVVAAIDTSKKVSISIQLRGFRAYPTRTSYYVLKYSKMDYFVFITVVIYIVCFLIMFWRY